MSSHMIIEKSAPLNGEARLLGAKNAVLVIMASLILARGKSILRNVPCSDDVINMIQLLESLGACVQFFKQEHILHIDTSSIENAQVSEHIMKKMRASILVMGPLLARFKRASIAFPGGCVLGPRPIDYHLKNFRKMGAIIQECGNVISAQADVLRAQRLVLEYPSVGATENSMMAAVMVPGLLILLMQRLSRKCLI